jgi:RNA polymerase sigma-70 factor (ECF subfamily)
MESSEHHLVRRCLAGERDAFDSLYDRHASRVFNLLHRLTASEAEAEDLTQETFIAAYRSLASWRGHGAFGTWLCGIAWLQYNNARRRMRAEIEELDEETHHALPDADPLAACLRHELGQQIEAAIAALPPLAREAFVLVKVEGLSYREAAEWLGVPLGTVQSRLWRAMGLLQAALADLAAPEDPSPAPIRSLSP